MILILAQVDSDASTFAMNNGLRYGSWRFIDDVRDLEGYVGDPYVVLQGFHMRKDADEILAAVKNGELMTLQESMDFVETCLRETEGDHADH